MIARVECVAQALHDQMTRSRRPLPKWSEQGDWVRGLYIKDARAVLAALDAFYDRDDVRAAMVDAMRIPRDAFGPCPSARQAEMVSEAITRALAATRDGER